MSDGKNDLAGGLAKHFAAYSELFQEAMKRLQGVQDRIRALTRQRRELHNRHSRRDEFKGAIFSVVDRLAEEGMNRRLAMIEAWSYPGNRAKPLSSFSPVHLTWTHVRAVMEGTADFAHVGLPFILASLPNETNPKGVLIDGAAICAVLGEAIKENLDKFFESLDWPDAESVEARLAQLQGVDAEIEGLRQEEAELLALINDNSISKVEED